MDGMYHCFCIPQVYTKATVNRYIALVIVRNQKVAGECSDLIYPDLPLQTLCLVPCLALHIFCTSPPALCLEIFPQVHLITTFSRSPSLTPL